MKTHHGRSLLFFLILVGRLLAEENWTHWQGVGGDATSDRSAHVVIRSRRDEAGDQTDLGYRFVYELHNYSGTQRAKVFLYYPVQDPSTRHWKEIDRETPTIVHELPPLGTVTGSVYSPSAHGLRFESGVKWPEELAAEEEQKQAAGEKSAGEVGDPAPRSKTAGPQAEFDGVPLSDLPALEIALRKYQTRDDDVRFRATMVFHIPPGQTDWQGIVDDAAVDMSGTWRERLEDWLSFVQKPLEISGRFVNYRLQIVSASATEMTVHFDNVTLDHLIAYVETQEDWGWKAYKPAVLELALLQPASSASAK
jgi:hypothetical protein